MIAPSEFYAALQKGGVQFFAGVPDSLLKDLCAYIADHTAETHHIIAANEGNAVALAAGRHLAAGDIPVVYMQNSGLGNAVNPLLSLADKKVYAIPMLLIIGWRGEPDKADEPQHLAQGAATKAMLSSMGIPYCVLDAQLWHKQTLEALEASSATKKPYAMVVRSKTFEPYSLQRAVRNPYPMSREDAMKLIVDHMPRHAVVVSTTGKLSRELFEYRKEKQQGHEQDFLTVGSMGHSSSIALAIALARPDKKVYCFDGDGAMLMHAGALATVGSLGPSNFIHILFNNGAHESVGGQPTAGFFVDFLKIAAGFGYKTTLWADDADKLNDALSRMHAMPAPTLLEIRVNATSRKNLGRPTRTPIENKAAFVKALRNE